jgi:hypothetical protein
MKKLLAISFSIIGVILLVDSKCLAINTTIDEVGYVAGSTQTIQTALNDRVSKTDPVLPNGIYTQKAVTASVGANETVNLSAVTGSGQAYILHLFGNSDSGYYGSWIVCDVAGGILSAVLVKHSTLSISQGAAHTIALTTTGGHAGQTYSWSITQLSKH